MPKVLRPIPEVYESISRPVAMEVMRRFFLYSGLPADTDIQFNGQALSVPQVGSTLDDEGNTFAKLPHTQRISISATESFPDGSVLTTAVMRPEQMTVFTDNDLHVTMKPIYKRTEIRFTINVRTQDKTSADRFRSALTTNFSRGFAEHLHEISYHYPIPQEFLVILYEIHQLRETVHPKNEDLGAYIRRCMTPRFTALTNQAGKHHTLVIRETQMRTLGWFDTNLTLERFEKDDTGGSYTVSFDYVFQYDQCTDMMMQYPIMIHNQVLSDRFRPSGFAYEWWNRFMDAGSSISDMLILSNPIWTSIGGYNGLSVPHFDDWLPPVEPPSTLQVLRFLLSVDLADKKDVINLQHLGDFSLKPVVLDYLMTVPQSLITPKGGAFGIQIYRGYEVSSVGGYTIDHDLNIRSVELLDPTKMYHLVLYLNYDPYNFGPEALRWLMIKGEFTRLYLLALIPNIEKDGLLPALGPNGQLSYPALQKALQYVKEHRLNFTVVKYYQQNYIGQFVITAHRETADAARTNPTTFLDSASIPTSSSL